MENKLRGLFDLQRFEQNPRLAKLIAQTEARCAQGIDDDDLEFVAAAGIRKPLSKEEKKDQNN